MSVYKRGNVYWYEFIFDKQRIQKSTKQGNRRVARQMEADYRTKLAKGEVGLAKPKAAPALRDFAQRFIGYIEVRCAAKPNTVSFYARKLAQILKFEALAAARLDRIDEALIENYVQYRIEQVSPASVNRELATLRRLLRMAHEWKVIDRVPRIRLLPGERHREFVLSHEQEREYLEATPQPLCDVAALLLDTGLRVGEAIALEWRDIHLEPVNGAKFGYLQVRAGKSRNAKRNLCLTARVLAMLERRQVEEKARWVFTNEDGTRLLSVSTLDNQHAKVRRALGLSKEFVIHSLRHTMLTRLGEAGTDTFTLMRIAGHSTVTVSQRYVHPSPEAVERAFERLEALNERAGQLALPANLPTPDEAVAAKVG